MAPFSCPPREYERSDPSGLDRESSINNIGTCSVSEATTSIPRHDCPGNWSQANFQEMAQLWKLSEDEKVHMCELQLLLGDISHWKNDPFEVVRYLREYKSVQKAAHMFRRMVDWRRANQMDSFLERYGEPPRLFHYLPTFLCQGMDRDGDPIYVERVGSSDPYGLVLAYGGVEPLAEYTAFIREVTTTRRLTADGNYCWQRDYYEPLMKRRMTQFTAIMDMVSNCCGIEG